jgi:hypothetical protein
MTASPCAASDKPRNHLRKVTDESLQRSADNWCRLKTEQFNLCAHGAVLGCDWTGAIGKIGKAMLSQFGGTSQIPLDHLSSD